MSDFIEQSSIENVESNYQHLFHFSGANKAGMQDIDKEKQAKVIYECSKNSNYFKRALEQDKKIDEKVAKMQIKLKSFKEPQLLQIKSKISKEVNDIELKRDFSRVCCVLDMDMFFAAVEIRDRPELKDKPVAVGGMSMISTANYVARKYGVRSAMPGFIAKKLCPSLVFVECNFQKYSDVSDQVKSIIAEYDSGYTCHSPDEMYFDLQDSSVKYLEHCFHYDISSCSSLNDYSIAIDEVSDLHRNVLESKILDPFESHFYFSAPRSSYRNCSKFPPSYIRTAAYLLLNKIRKRIFNATGGLTCSAGIANNFLLAKIGADVNKPDGQFEIQPNQQAVRNFLETLPTRKVWGVGKVLEKMLSSFDIKTVGQIRENLHIVKAIFTPKMYTFLLTCSHGMTEEELGRTIPSNKSNLKRIREQHDIESDDESTSTKGEEDILFDKNSTKNNPVVQDPNSSDNTTDRKSLSVERTFQAISSLEAQKAKLKEICNLLQVDLEDRSLSARQFTLKLKSFDFKLITRITKDIGKFMVLSSDFYPLVEELMINEQPISVRLIGVSASKFDVKKPGINIISKFLNTKPIDEKNKIANNFTDAKCPICEISLSSFDRFNVNSHIDACLIKSNNGGTISDSLNIAITPRKLNIACPKNFDVSTWDALPENIQTEIVKDLKFNINSFQKSPIKCSNILNKSKSRINQKDLSPNLRNKPDKHKVSNNHTITNFFSSSQLFSSNN